MYIPLDFIELMDVVEDCNNLRSFLMKIEKIAKKTDESNSDSQLKLIAATCEKALENKSRILSKTKDDLLEDWEYHIESIISGEYTEQFQV